MTKFKLIHKLTLLFLIPAFLSSDIAFASLYVDKLAAASRFDDMLGQERQAERDIKLRLGLLVNASRTGSLLDINKLRENADHYRDPKSKTQFFVHGMRPLANGNWVITCRTRTAGVKTYYGVISAMRGPVEVYSENEWNALETGRPGLRLAASGELPVGRASPYFIGSSMGGTKYTCVLYKNVDGKPTAVDSASIKWSDVFHLTDPRDIANSAKVDSDSIARVIAETVTNLVVKNGLKVENLNNIGCTSPGPLDEEAGVIGSVTRTFNMPFDKYPFVAELKKALNTDLVELRHDAHAGVEGEVALGGLSDVENGYYVIQGTGLGGSPAMQKKYYTKIPELTEPGHHLVGSRDTSGDYTFRFIEELGKEHPYEVVRNPDSEKAYQITEDQAMAVAEDDAGHDYFIWAIRGEKDLEDIVAGVGLEAMLKDKRALAQMFEGEEGDYSDMNMPEDISELALNGSERQKLDAQLIIRYVARQMGRALACLIAASYKKEWEIKKIVIGSGIGEKFGIDKSGKMLGTLFNDDAYFYWVNNAAKTALTNHYRIPPEFAESISIVRSPITQDKRETAGFSRQEAARAAGSGDFTVRILLADEPDSPDTRVEIEKLAASFEGRAELIQARGAGKDTAKLREVIEKENPAIVLIRSTTTAFKKDPNAPEKSAEFINFAKGHGVKAIVRMGSGVDNVDLKEAGKAGIAVIPTYGNENSVANLDLRFLLCALERPLERKVVSETKDLDQDPGWNPAFDVSLSDFNKGYSESVAKGRGNLTAAQLQDILHPISNERATRIFSWLRDKTIGLVGFGHTAQALAEKLNMFRKLTGINFTIMATSTSLDDPGSDSPKTIERKAAADKFNVLYPGEEVVLKNAHILSLHLPEGEKTKGWLNKDRLEPAKNVSIIINTARQGLMNTPALRRFLSADRNRLYLADVDFKVKGQAQSEIEQLMVSHPGQVFALPHIAASTDNAARGVEGKARPTLKAAIETLLGLEPSSSLESVSGAPLRSASNGESEERIQELATIVGDYFAEEVIDPKAKESPALLKEIGDRLKDNLGKVIGYLSIHGLNAINSINADISALRRLKLETKPPEGDSVSPGITDTLDIALCYTAIDIMKQALGSDKVRYISTTLTRIGKEPASVSANAPLIGSLADTILLAIYKNTPEDIVGSRGFLAKVTERVDARKASRAAVSTGGQRRAKSGVEVKELESMLKPLPSVEHEIEIRSALIKAGRNANRHIERLRKLLSYDLGRKNRIAILSALLEADDLPGARLGQLSEMHETIIWRNNLNEAMEEERMILTALVRHASKECLAESGEVGAAISVAEKAGLEIPTHPDARYTLLLPFEFFYNGELDEYRARYGDRFNIERVNASSIYNILAKARGIETKAVVLVPNDTLEPELKRLTDAGIRFIRTPETRPEKDEYRRQFQLNTFVTMLLVRYIEEGIPKDSPVYKTLSFYLASHFELDRIAIADYIEAIVKGDVAMLIRGYLSYRPAQAYRVPKYKEVAATLIAA